MNWFAALLNRFRRGADADRYVPPPPPPRDPDLDAIHHAQHDIINRVTAGKLRESMRQRPDLFNEQLRRSWEGRQ